MPRTIAALQAPSCAPSRPGPALAASQKLQPSRALHSPILAENNSGAAGARPAALPPGQAPPWRPHRSCSRAEPSTVALTCFLRARLLPGSRYKKMQLDSVLLKLPSVLRRLPAGGAAAWCSSGPPAPPAMRARAGTSAAPWPPA